MQIWLMILKKKISLKSFKIVFLIIVINLFIKIMINLEM